MELTFSRRKRGREREEGEACAPASISFSLSNYLFRTLSLSYSLLLFSLSLSLSLSLFLSLAFSFSRPVYVGTPPSGIIQSAPGNSCSSAADWVRVKNTVPGSLLAGMKSKREAKPPLGLAITTRALGPCLCRMAGMPSLLCLFFLGLFMFCEGVMH